MKTLTFIVTIILIAVFVNVTAYAKTWYVDDDGQDCPDADFTTIQEAVDAAGDGDSIAICSGTYTENIEVREKNGLAIQGHPEQETSIVDGGVSSGKSTLLVVNSEGINLEHLKLINGGPVVYYSASTGSILSNVISGGAGTYGDGIEIASYSLVTVEYNIIEDNERYGIGAWESEATISGNTITNGEPVVVYFASTGSIFGNVISGGTGTYSDGIEIANYSLVTIENNTIRDNERLGIGAWESEVTISENTITNNEEDGVYVQGPTTGKTSSVDLPSAEEVIVESSPEVEKKVIYHAVPSLPAFGAKPNDRILSDALNYTTNPGLATIQENEISNNNRMGIILYDGSKGTIINNVVENNSYGIALASDNNVIRNNTVSSNDDGIYVRSDNNVIENNTVSSNKSHGIAFARCSENTLSGNIMANNKYNIYFVVSSTHEIHKYYDPFSNILITRNYYYDTFGDVSNYIQHIDDSNKVDGKPVYYLVNEHDKVISSDAGFVGVVNSTNITVKDLTIQNNKAGVLFVNTTNSRIENVQVSDNEYGVVLLESSNNQLVNNDVKSNSNGGFNFYSSGGIYLYSSSENTLTDNITGSNGRYGILLNAPRDTTLSSNNTLVNNNTSKDGITILRSPATTLQNNTVSSTGDGICLLDSPNSALKNNNASGNGYGIVLEGTSNSTAENNSTVSNGTGILLLDASDNTLKNNTILKNSLGIRDIYAEDNVLYLNNFALNSYAYQTSDNRWYSPEKMAYTYNGKEYENYLGNYWDEYIGDDENGDGIGDTPYEVDNYPLMLLSESYTGEDDPGPPSTITNLVASNSTINSVALFWKAPGDNVLYDDFGFGTVAEYDIRYSTSSITESNWDSATQVDGEPFPKPAGYTDSFVVDGLSPNTTYYFAIKTKDDVGNWSDLSNIAEITTSNPDSPPIVYVNDVEGNDDTGMRGDINKPFKTIQAGIEVAINGDMVLVADGTYTGFGNKDIDFRGKNITVKSENGAENCIIDCEHSGRGFYIYGCESSASLDGFTIINGATSSGGGGIYCENSSVTIQNNIITNNRGGDGGGIYCENSSVTIQNNIITKNRRGDDGGGIYCENSSVTIQNNIITKNRADNGGGIYCSNASPVITNNTIAGNSAEFVYGGGIYCCDNSSPTITNNTIADNSACFYGGGIYCSNSSPTITNNTIAGNSAEFVHGGGIYCDYHSSPKVLNTILWGNTPDQIYGVSTITYSDIQGGWKGEGNIDADPLFVDPDNGIYYLQAGSPCLSSANCEEAPETDKDGRPRPLGSGCDMGCYEQYDDGTILIYGDVSWDCNVTAYDAALALQYVVGSKDLSEGQQQAADVTGNGSITALDAALILQYTVGLITLFPVETKTAAPILAVQSEEDMLVKAIAQLEATALNREQKQVLEQLKSLVFNKSLPKHTALLQNFPNPFNPDTWLPYQLAQDSPVTINIYNVKGQLVRTLHLGNQNAGVYVTKDKAAYWDGRDNLGEKGVSGLYFYTLQAGEFRATRKMAIVK